MVSLSSNAAPDNELVDGETDGEITAAARALVAQVEDGRLSREALGQKCDAILRRTAPYFAQIRARVRAGTPATAARLFSGHAARYRDEKARALDGVETLLRAGVRALGSFAESAGATDRNDGLYLISRAERELSDLLRQIEADRPFPLSQLNIGADFYADLVEKRLAGTLLPYEYETLLDAWRAETLAHVQQGADAFVLAMERLRGFEGRTADDFCALDQGADLLQSAARHFAQVLSNVQEPPLEADEIGHNAGNEQPA